jgi:hypothetical protein
MGGGDDVAAGLGPAETDFSVRREGGRSRLSVRDRGDSWDVEILSDQETEARQRTRLLSRDHSSG